VIVLVVLNRLGGFGQLPPAFPAGGDPGSELLDHWRTGASARASATPPAGREQVSLEVRLVDLGYLGAVLGDHRLLSSISVRILCASDGARGVVPEPITKSPLSPFYARVDFTPRFAGRGHVPIMSPVSTGHG
jgi:hypothetical protein